MNKETDERFAFVLGIAVGMLIVGSLWGFWTSSAWHDPIREAAAWLRTVEKDSTGTLRQARDIRKRLEVVLKEKGR